MTKKILLGSTPRVPARCNGRHPKMPSQDKTNAKHCSLVINNTVLFLQGPALKYQLKPYLHCYTGWGFSWFTR